MKLYFKERLFSWLDSYDVYNEEGEPVYSVKGQLSFGHCLKIYDADGREAGAVKERIFTFLPKFEIYLGETRIGCIQKELTLLKPKYHIDFNGWRIEGNFLEWDYTILDESGHIVASVAKEIFNITDTYTINVADPKNALCALMFVLAVDAEKCSRSN